MSAAAWGWAGVALGFVALGLIWLGARREQRDEDMAITLGARATRSQGGVRKIRRVHNN